MEKTTTTYMMLVMAITAITIAPTASADHGNHECTDEDPCDDIGKDGCDPIVSVGGCEYEYHDSCTYGKGADGTQSEFCRHHTRHCMINVGGRCYHHGSTLNERMFAPIIDLDYQVPFPHL